MEYRMSHHHHRHAFNVYDPLEPQKRRGREIYSMEEPSTTTKMRLKMRTKTFLWNSFCGAGEILKAVWEGCFVEVLITDCGIINHPLLNSY